MPEFRQFSDWKKALLSRREIERPDGRALYLYRLSEDEFSDLELLLRKWLEKLRAHFELSLIATLSGFAVLFVLYAAEWWRRRYDGSGFSWEPILRDLGAKPEEWSPSQRSEFVRLGLRGWGLKPRESGALRFLGSVAIQGGLPLKLLATARGGIGHLLSRVLQLAAGSQVTQEDLQTWVESLSTMLPKSYRQTTIFTLLADVAWTVLQLKHEAGLTSSVDATTILDKKVSGWRERFPLPIEDQHAQGMIEQLIQDAASVRIERRAVFLPLERVLESISEGDWSLRSQLMLTDTVTTEQLAKLFDVKSEEMPRTADLSLIVDEFRQTTSLRRLAGHNSYRVERKPWGLSGEMAASEHLLQMESPDGRVWSVTASKGDALDHEIPWVFIERNSIYVLAKQGSGNIASQDALIAIPVDWHIHNQPDSEVKEMGNLALPGRKVLQVRGVMKAQRSDGMAFRVRTGHAGAVEETYLWGGDRYWLDFYSPRIAFKGMPNLYRLAEDDTKRRVDGQIGCTVVGGNGFTHAIGPVYLRYPATGDVKYRSKVLVLPEEANIEINPADAVSGSIHFKDWGAAAVRVLTTGIEQKISISANNIFLDLSMVAGRSAPDLIDLEAYWPHTKVPATFRVPYPAKGVRAFDGTGREIENSGLLAAQQLSGTRLIISGGQVNSHIEMKIIDHTGSNVRKYRLRTLPDALSLVIRLQDYSGDIHQLFSIYDLPDARVTVAIRVHGALMFTLKLARYSAVLEREDQIVRLDTEVLKLHEIEELEQLPVLAIRLESPGDEAVSLPACESEGVITGAWLFSPQEKSPGSWLIYPGAEALLPFRPTLWVVEGKVGEENRLSSALSISEQNLRMEMIDEVIDELASDFGNTEWDHIEQLASQVGHLPLATLDLWRRFVRSPKGMAALALRFGGLKTEFFTRFSQELPFAWETISYHEWRTAMNCLEAQCIKTFGDKNFSTILKSHLDSRIKLLSALNGSLSYLLGIAGVTFLPETVREVELLKFLGSKANKALFDGERSPLMALRRSHEKGWPTDFKVVLETLDVQPLILDYLYKQESEEKIGIINMPLLLAAQASTNQTDDWFVDTKLVHILNRYRAFDPEWFDEAYNQTIAHCLADGLLLEEQINE